MSNNSMFLSYTHDINFQNISRTRRHVHALIVLAREELQEHYCWVYNIKIVCCSFAAEKFLPDKERTRRWYDVT